MKQNAQLEREITRLNLELDETTKGILKRGYLFKFRDREISFASKWGLRYFVLQGKNISYYIDDRELRPRKTFSIEGCIVRDDGVKKGRYHILSVYWPSVENSDEVGNLLLRLSTDRREDAIQWMYMLDQACAVHEPDISLTNESETTIFDTVNEMNPTDSGETWSDNPIDTEVLLKDGNSDSHRMTIETLKRVKSSSLILQKSMSRSAALSKLSLGDIPPTLGSHSKVSQLRVKIPSRSLNEPHVRAQPGNSKQILSAAELRRRRFPASKPIHTEAKFSPLSSEVRPGEQNYRGFFNLVSEHNEPIE